MTLQNGKCQLEPVTINLKGFEKEINVSTKSNQSLSKTNFLFVFQKKSQTELLGEILSCFFGCSVLFVFQWILLQSFTKPRIIFHTE